MKDLPMNLKNAKITMEDGVEVEETKQLDGGAKDSPVMQETNETVQYKTASLPSGDLGGKNNLDG